MKLWNNKLLQSQKQVFMQVLMQGAQFSQQRIQCSETMIDTSQLQEILDSLTHCYHDSICFLLSLITKIQEVIDI